MIEINGTLGICPLCFEPVWDDEAHRQKGDKYVHEDCITNKAGS